MEDIKIQENGETEVQVACIGEVIGSDIHGNAVKQNFSEDSLKRIAEMQSDDILVDADHSSETGGSTEAKGWLSKLNFVPGKGLFGTIKWTDIGRKLIENRVFRWLSPSWKLNAKTMEPLTMTSCALTNKPSQIGRIEPIINAEPQDSDLQNEAKDITDMDKEELKALIKSMIEEALNEKCKNEEAAETTEEEVKEEETCNEEVKEEVKEEATETTEEEVKEEEPVKEEVKEEEEVIKEEALNSAPTIQDDLEPAWKNLHGREFFDYIRKNNIH